MKRWSLILLLPLLCGCAALPGFFVSRANRALSLQQPTQFTMTAEGDIPFSLHAETVRSGSISCTELALGDTVFTAYIADGCLQISDGTAVTEHTLPPAVNEPFLLPDTAYSAAECPLPHECLSLCCSVSGSELMHLADTLPLAADADITSACMNAVYCLDPKTFLPKHIVFEVSSLSGDTVRLVCSDFGYASVDVPLSPFSVDKAHGKR